MENEKSNVWKSRWQEKLLLSKDKYDYIMITNGNYTDEEDLDNGEVNPYWVGSFYNVSANNNFRQWRNNNDPESTLFIRRELNDERVSYPKNQYFFNVVHFDIYRKEEVRDKNGKVIIAKRGPNQGQPLMGWQVVKSLRDRNQCAKNPDENVTFFRKKYMQVGPKHYDDLSGVITKARELCHCGDSLHLENYQCENCGADMLNMDDSNLTVEDVNRFGDAPKRCSSCRHRGWPVPVLECGSCDNPTPHRFDQVIAKVKKTGTGPQTAILVDSVISALDYRMENKQPIVEMDDEGKPIIEDDAFMYIEDLEYIANVTWDFDSGNPAPDNSEVSTFLGLESGDDGYDSSSGSYTKTKKNVSRRRFR